MNPGGSKPLSQRLSKRPYPDILSLINPTPRIDTYFFKINSHLHLGLPRNLLLVGIPYKILKALLPCAILATCSAHLNLLDLIILIMKILIVEPFPLPIPIHFGHFQKVYASLFCKSSYFP